MLLKAIYNFPIIKLVIISGSVFALMTNLNYSDNTKSEKINLHLNITKN